MRAPSSFTHDFLLLFAGPLIWAAHFLAIYGFTGVLCARPSLAVSWLGIGISTWAIVGAGALAIAGAGACLAIRPQDAEPDNRRFVRWTSVGLAWLSIVAIAWETMTVFLIPSCA